MQTEAERRGIKRKRWEPTKHIDVASKFSGRLHNSLKEIQRAGKKAKVYETQRIIKRLKKSGTSNDKVSSDKISSDYEDSLENELKALKLIDTDSIMKKALLTRVRKDGVLSKDERIRAVMQKFGDDNVDSAVQALGKIKETPARRVEVRIRSSKTVAEVMKSCVEGLRDLVLGKDATRNKGRDTDAYDGPNPEEKIEHVEANFTDGAGTGAGTDDERSPSDGFSDAGWESGSIDDTDLKHNEAEEGGVDSEWESGSVSSTRKVQSTKKRSKLKASKDVPQKAPLQSTLVPMVSTTRIQSTFLPTLASGYVGGDSSAGDQWSDGENSFTKERKNRRGQRARRAIWEKKYGRHANHVKKRKEQMQAKPRNTKLRTGRVLGGPDRGASTRTGYHRPHPYPTKPTAVYSSDFHSHNGSAFRRYSFRCGSGQPRVLPNGTQDERPLHPSWEAKRKAKEKMGAVTGSNASGITKGTKIKFD